MQSNFLFSVQKSLCSQFRLKQQPSSILHHRSLSSTLRPVKQPTFLSNQIFSQTQSTSIFTNNLRASLLFREYASKNNKSNTPPKKEAPPPPTKPKTTGGSTKYVMHMKGITKHVGEGRTLFEDLNLAVFEGAKIGLLGANGSGKSSLLKIIAGEDIDFEGEMKVYNGVTIGYLAQEPELDDEKTVRENILESVADKKAILDEYLELNSKLEARKNPEDPIATSHTVAEWNAIEARHKKLGLQVDQLKLHDLNRKIERAIDALRCPPGDSAVDGLSGGERRRVALARLLIASPDVLLLDEPTNHLDAESVAWLERYLSEFRGTVMAITHDRYFLDNVAKWILEIDRGHCFPFQGNYSAWLENRALRMDRESKQEDGRKKLLAQELAWIRSGAKARQAKNKTRIAAFNRLVEQSQDAQVARAKASNAGGSIVIKPGPRLGDVVVNAQGLTKSIEGRTLFANLSFNLPPGSIVGVIGANGSGKSTLFNILAGNETPDEGSIKIGATVQMALVAQVRADQLVGDNTVYEEVAEGQDTITIGESIVQTRAYLAAFNFRGTSQSKLISGLSGGERNRVQLAKMLKRGCNLLLLDEPTNDLDVEVLRSLENALAEFPGSAVVISHDRYFLDRLCTHILAFEGDSYVHFFNGNYSEYDEDKRRRLGGKYVEPGRIRFKKIETV